MPGDISRIFRLIFTVRKGVNQDSSVDIAIGWTAGVRFPAEARDSYLFHTVQTVSGPQAASCTVGIGVKRQGREADHSPSSSGEVKIVELHSLIVFMAWLLIS
jgi:hypothetical protein